MKGFDPLQMMTSVLELGISYFNTCNNTFEIRFITFNFKCKNKRHTTVQIKLKYNVAFYVHQKNTKINVLLSNVL